MPPKLHFAGALDRHHTGGWILCLYYSIKRQTYLLLWTAAGQFSDFTYLGQALAQGTPSSALKTRWIMAVHALRLALFPWRTDLLAAKAWKIPALILAVFFGAVAAANAAKVFALSEVIPASMLYVAVAIVFWQESRRQETLADRLWVFPFASWGVLWGSSAFLEHRAQLQGASINVVATRLVPS